MKPDACESLPIYVPRAITFLAVIATIAALYWGRDLLLPLALATFIAFMLAPAVRWVESARLGRFLSVMLVSLAALAIIATSSWIVARQTTSVLAKLPEHREKIISRIRAARAALPASVGGATEAVAAISREIVSGATRAPASATQPVPDNALTQDTGESDETALAQEQEAAANGTRAAQPVQVEMAPAQSSAAETFGLTISMLIRPLTLISLASIFAIFFLIYREDLRDRIVRLCGRAHISVTTAALTDVGTRITHYMLAQVISNSVCGMIIGLGLFMMGVPQAFLWGLIAGVLRFVPFFGPCVAAVLPAVLSLATSDNALTFVSVLAWFLLVDLSIGNFFEPWFYGTRVGASPTAILLGIVFWGWLWGAAGILLATPLLVCLVVLGKHVPAFENLYVIFGDGPVLEPKMRFYQRLLAADQTEALEVVSRESATASINDALDDIVLPALAQLEADRQDRVVDEERILASKVTVAALLESARSKIENQRESVTPIDSNNVLCAVGLGQFDECLCEIVEFAIQLDRFDARRAIRIQRLSSNAFASEIAECVSLQRPCGVFIAAVGPRDLGRIELLCRRVRRVSPSVPIVIGLIPRPGVHYWRAESLGRIPGARLATNLTQMLLALRRLAFVHDDAESPYPALAKPEITFAS